MTIREKLKELHEWVQQSYGFGELFFGVNLPYRLELMDKIMSAYATEFPDHSYHVKNEHQKHLKKALKDSKEIAVKKDAIGFVQNKYLNGVKSDEINAYWLFVQFVDGQRNGFFEKPFDEYQV